MKAFDQDDADVVVSGFNVDLTGVDFRRLEDTEWLNDEVLVFFCCVS